MKATKAFGLAALALMAVFALFGPTAADADEIVLCKALEELCAESNQWPSETETLMLASNAEFKGSFSIKCEDSIIRGKTTTEAGSPLPGEATYAEYGKLPKPELGVGCTGCPFGLKTEVHMAPFLPFATQVKVSSKDEFKLLVSNYKLLVLCGSIKCGLESKDLESGAIKHTGTHAEHSGGNLPSIKFEAIYTVYEDSSGAGVCGNTATWDATYILYLAHHGASSGLAWPSLGIPIPHEIVLCKTLVLGGELCPTESFYPAGTKLVALAENPEFKAAPFSALKCEDSVIEGETTASMGSTLGIEINKIAFGKLPIPELGKGCTTCTAGVHPPPVVTATVEMTKNSDYVLKSSEAFELLSCFGLGVTCLYGSDGLVSLVDSDAGKHKSAEGEKGLAQILVSGTLSFIKGSNFCPETGTWTANYVVYTLESEGKTVQGWLALYRAL